MSDRAAGVLVTVDIVIPRLSPSGSGWEVVLIRRLNLRVLGVASIQLNTFPSGHAAAAAATALAVGARLPLAGVVFGLLALGIAIGSVVGRYHYAADALAGGVIGIVGFLISQS